ncbi:hypothetical protein GIB67_018039 [Kingdonia uniflora]|uniref:RNase H type-1 domain-containing protein n=1 Tax=Kingdonia uniflora TaxID=39325 RepID=A0A7J7NWD3_9MAGN|nr:hypothetical protein GIB67_018039 [Kingdonia uniflora]
MHPRKLQVIKSCFWDLVKEGEVKINSDGASRGNPFEGGTGFIIRDHVGKVLRTFFQGLGTATSYIEKCTALLQGLQKAASNRWLIAWSEADSVAAVEAFSNNKVP